MLSRGQRALVGCAIGGLALTIAYTCASRLALRTYGMSELFVILANNASMWTLGAALYPVVWLSLVGLDVATHAPLALIGLAWPPVLFWFDLYWVPHQIADGARTADATTTLDANTLSSLAFAMGGLLVTSGLGSQFVRAASPILSACIFLIISFCIRNPSFRPGSTESAIISSIQKVSLAWCTGLLLTAVAINLHFGLKQKEAQATALVAKMQDGS